MGVKRPTWRLLLVAIIVSFFGTFPSGYFYCSINTSFDVYKRFLNSTFLAKFSEPVDDETFSFIWGLSFSLYCVGGVVGLAFVPWIVERIGRKWTLVAANLPVIVGSFILYLAQQHLSYDLFVFGRFVCGLNSGCSCAVNAMFLSEISPAEVRGMITAMQETALCFSGLAGTLLGMPELLGTDEQLTAMMLLPIVPALAMMAAMLPVPDSPRHLLLTLKDDALAEHAIRFYHGADVHVEEVKKAIRDETSHEHDASTISIVACWRKKSIRDGIAIGVAASLAAAVSGVSVIYAFSTEMFHSAGVSLEFAKYGTLGMAGLNTLTSLVAGFCFLERMGRRRLLLGSLIATIATGVCFVLFSELSMSSVGGNWAAILMVGSIFVYVFVFSFGAGPIPWSLLSELVPQVARSLAQTFAEMLIYGVTIVQLFAFYPTFEAIGTYSFLIFATAPSAMLTAFLYRELPETRGREIADIVTDLRERRESKAGRIESTAIIVANMVPVDEADEEDDEAAFTV